MDWPFRKNAFRVDPARASAELLFALAQELARQQGALTAVDMASQAQSVLSPVSYALKSEQGVLISRIPIRRLRKAITRRCHDLQLLVRRAGIRSETMNAFWLNRQKLAQRSRWILPLAWAISTGEPYPRPGHPLLRVLITLVLLLCGVLPGLIYLAVLARRRRQDLEVLKHLDRRWRARGTPHPNRDFLLLLQPQSATGTPA